VRKLNPPQPWPAYVWGIVILLIGVFVMALMLFSEEQAASAPADLPALAYMLAGKWGLAAFFLLLAVVFFGLEIHGRRGRRQHLPRDGTGLDTGGDL
jgi:hypothetical protein